MRYCMIAILLLLVHRVVRNAATCRDACATLRHAATLIMPDLRKMRQKETSISNRDSENYIKLHHQVKWSYCQFSAR